MVEPRSQSPEDDGIPGYADDTSMAEDLGIRPAISDSEPALPTDGPDFSQAFGVTASQTRHGESLSKKLAREQPDRYRPADDEDGHVGRLVGPDAGSGINNEAEAIGFDSREQEGLTAEEAAMHILPTDADPPLD